MHSLSEGEGIAGLIVLIAVGIVAVLGGLLWWLLIYTEGVYLGQQVVIWLYDLYANRYDRIKEFQPEYEYALLADPIMAMLRLMK